MGVLYFIIALSVLVAIHEFGHFICAKLFNVYVYEFSLFMGPKIVQVKKGETKYTLRLLPIGGYCSMAGELDLQAERNEQEERSKKDNPNADVEPLPDIPKERTLSGVASWKKLIISSAGAIMNILFCFVLLVIYFGFNGIPEDTGKITVAGESLFEEAGLETGDILLNVDSTMTVVLNSDSTPKVYSESDYEITTYDSITAIDKEILKKMRSDLVDEDSNNKFADFKTISQTNTYEIQKVDGTKENVSVTREYIINVGNDGITTISYPSWGIMKGTHPGDFGEVIVQAFNEEVYLAGAIYRFIFVDLWTDKNAAQGVTGIVGIAALSNDIIKTGGLLYFIWFVAYISVNLGIMNLLPLPALDGGRHILTIYEMITRKKVNPKVEGTINNIGFIALMVLMVIITISDILKL